MIKTVGSGFLVPEEAQHWPRARRFSSAISTRFHRRSRRTISDRSRVATYLASLAVRALIEEAELPPKAALVDERGPGAHTDLSLTLMKSSAHCLRPGFELMPLASFRQIPGRTLREDLGTIGRRAERSMLLTTGGVNTHRGAIWTLSLRSTVIEESGLIGALQMLVERSNVAGRLRCNFRSNCIPEETLPPRVQHELLRIAQEAISNAIRHGEPTVVIVTLRWEAPHLILQIKDNGSGIPKTRRQKSETIGLRSMRERAAQIGAQLVIRTGPSRGTRIIVTVPISV